jgi:3-methyladenine DNA glycosylase Mpg
MEIDKAENTVDLTRSSSGLWIEAGVRVSDSLVTKSPRVGLNNVPEPWKSKPWRFMVKSWKIS